MDWRYKLCVKNKPRCYVCQGNKCRRDKHAGANIASEPANTRPSSPLDLALQADAAGCGHMSYTGYNTIILSLTGCCGVATQHLSVKSSMVQPLYAHRTVA